jgi:DNA polymerase-3 subunit delta
MTEILHNQLADHLKGNAGAPLPSVLLIHGQEMLVEQAAELLVERLLEGASRDLCCEVVEGLVERIGDVLAQLNTFSLLAGPKIVLFKEARLFEARGSDQRLVEQIIEAYQGEDLHQAAKALISLCGHMEMGLEEILQASAGREPLHLLFTQLGPDGVEKVTRYGLDQGWRPAATGDHVQSLQRAIEKGFGDHHHLVITVTAKVPKNLKLYKSIRDHGWIIDCNVPMGERRADRMAQESVLRQTLETALAAAGKRVQPGIFENLCQLTGFDLRTFAQNVEKLIDYSGARTLITAEDVQAVLRRTKSDPIFELTNAVADRDLQQSLFYLHTLLKGDWYPLQILAALANQIRKLVVARDFAGSEQGKCWSAGMSYHQFQSVVMPAIQAFDKQIQEAAAAWWPASKGQGEGKAGGSKASSEIALAPNPNNPYPVYQTMLKSERYTQSELARSLALLNQTDLRLKSSGQDASIVLKKTILDICGRQSR